MSSPSPAPSQAKGVSVEEIIGGTRCSPLTLKEFEGFLIHEEHSVENLQFTIWYRSYCERFAALPPEYQALSSPPAERYTHFSTPAGSIRTAASINEKDKAPSWWEKLVLRRSTVSLEDRELEMGEKKEEQLALARGANNHFPAEGAGEDGDDNISLRSACAPIGADPSAPSVSPFPITPRPPTPTGTPAPNDRQLNRVNTALSAADTDNSSMNSEALDRKSRKFPNLRFANLSPIGSLSSREKVLPEDTPLPFVDEISLVLSTFFLPGATKELNIDARLRKHIFKCLQPKMEDGSTGPPVTTHPEVFKEAAEHVFTLMERSLPHYLTWASGNTNTPKMLFWYAVGATDVGLGVMIALITMYFAGSRWWRLFSFLFIQFGTMQAYSASRYFCSQVHGRAARQLYPWELTSELDSSSDAVSTPAFTIAMTTATPASRKLPESLAASMSFLFEDSAAPSSVVLDTGAANKGTSMIPNLAGAVGMGSLRPPAVFRSKWFASMRREDGKRVPVFGPERVVEDPYIQALHNKQIKEILIVGAVVMVLFEIMIVAIPEQRRR